MSVQHLDRTLVAYRIGDPDSDYPIFDATGSRFYPGRWNDADSPVIYASGHYATAMLEKLVHGSGQMPPNQHYIAITLPRGISFEAVTKDTLPGWDDEESVAAREVAEPGFMGGKLHGNGMISRGSWDEIQASRVPVSKIKEEVGV